MVNHQMIATPPDPSGQILEQLEMMMGMICPIPSDPLKGLTRFQMNKFGGKESQYEYWKLQFQASYGARSISAKEKTLFLLSLLEGEPSILCARFVRHNIDNKTYETLWEVLDRRYGGQIREDQQVMEEFDKIKALESYDVNKSRSWLIA